jgi:hypothetical protein
LSVQWGTQDHYEIVRKVGRGKYSEVRLPSSPWYHFNRNAEPQPLNHGLSLLRTLILSLSGLRIHPSPVLVQMYRQGAQTRQEEEDQEGDQDLAKLGRRAECHRALGRC